MEELSTEELIFSFRSHVYVGAGFAFTVQSSTTLSSFMMVSVELECCGLSEEDRDTFLRTTAS